MPGRHNVVIVVIDALRADRVGDTMGAESLTPNIDAIGADGTFFENTFACAPNTDPSVTSIHTGRYPLNTVYHHGKFVTDGEKRRVESTRPLASVLSSAGWETVAVGQGLGRWHSRGFDRYPGSKGTGTVRSQAMDISRRAFEVVNGISTWAGSTIRSLYNLPNRRMKPNVVMQDYDPTDLVSAIDSSPFFGFVHLMDTHTPYLGTTEDFDDLVARRDYPDAPVEAFLPVEELTDAQVDRVTSAVETLGIDHPGELLALYDAAVRYADRKVGRLVEALQASGYWEDTVLFVTADHGESLFEHGIFLDHHGLYDDVLHVPLVTNLGDGARVTELVQLPDIAPTALDLLDVTAPEMDGQSLKPLIRGEESSVGRTAVFSEEAYTQRRIAARTDRWKLIRHEPDEVIEDARASSLRCGYCEVVHGSERELYDLAEDPGEADNLAADVPEELERLEAAYETFKADLVPPTATDEQVRYEGEDGVLSRLEAIGYK